MNVALTFSRASILIKVLSKHMHSFPVWILKASLVVSVDDKQLNSIKLTTVALNVVVVSNNMAVPTTKQIKAKVVRQKSFRNCNFAVSAIIHPL